MKPIPSAGDRAIVFGLGVSGMAVTEHLLSRGVSVYGVEEKPTPAIREKLSHWDVPLLSLTHPLPCAEFAFRSPGMRPDHPLLLQSLKKGAILTGETDYFSALCPCPIIAVSGSDGKTTTAKMISLALEAGGYSVFLGGNIGRSLLPYLSRISEKSFVVLEVSSFQLMDVSFSPRVGVLTNLTPNHLDCHTDMREYTLCKKRLPLCSQRAVLPFGLFEDLDKTLPDITRFSVTHSCAYEKRGKTLFARGEPLLDDSQMQVGGLHNQANLLAASAALEGIVPLSVIRGVGMTFKGVSHRMETVCLKNGVKYIDSSIDTTPSRVLTTLRGVPMKEGHTHLLLGGSEKGLSFDELAKELSRYPVIPYVYGDAKAHLAEALSRKGVAFGVFSGMEEALNAAKKAAKPGDTVLLSPACASFDEFANYIQRGNVFKQTVFL
ncbi:MAG: UDP-N-acetylmuramoyl-L-alanine--D-glutamate ligase [Clostridia bacterium]|nr:UDP-N-acetylmuramoyl-L-alanine--D-glutamate ligase [Clostridia bacterium]